MEKFQKLRKKQNDRFPNSTLEFSDGRESRGELFSRKIVLDDKLPLPLFLNWTTWIHSTWMSWTTWILRAQQIQKESRNAFIILVPLKHQPCSVKRSLKILWP